MASSCCSARWQSVKASPCGYALRSRYAYLPSVASGTSLPDRFSPNWAH
jgi:hypothetical protein